jgi:hypothetical protein
MGTTYVSLQALRQCHSERDSSKFIQSVVQFLPDDTA